SRWPAGRRHAQPQHRLMRLHIAHIRHARLLSLRNLPVSNHSSPSAPCAIDRTWDPTIYNSWAATLRAPVDRRVDALLGTEGPARGLELGLPTLPRLPPLRMSAGTGPIRNARILEADTLASQS